ncbi:beta-1,4-galactosyltransferase galt-1-like [Rana temporaria]|uniref:beta-1,4-galactosyltransferase galt-1-like n=1 Tax=Rana temporaria TaxID=8407 RepID=UPI001AACBFFE|nr:beta-1,4-galactosyltransferase galt-1-like [Rana temporaria]XP_040186501.1 beta-1,4-galactosyltransferase galt-1-like [Rana temporaria]
MWMFLRYMLWTLSIFGGVAVIFFSYHVQIRQKMRSQELPIATDTITALDHRTFIISPYYEPRLGQLVRVIAILHLSVKELYCIFRCSPDQNVFVRAQIDFHRDNFGFPYGMASLLCAEPSGCDYTYMSFSSIISTNTSQDLLFKVRNRQPQTISSNFTVCISTLYGNYNNVLQMIQSIEMYKILGASRVTIYKTNCSRDVDKVLRHYIDEGTLEVVPWPIDRHLRTSKMWKYTPGLTAEIGYFGQITALNDCLYRNMYKSKFVLLNDHDEIILPIIDRDWSSLMESLQKQFPDTSVFRFEARVFLTSDNSSKFDLWPHVPGVNILRHALPNRVNQTMHNPRKMIVNPRKVFETSVHYAPKYDGTSTNVPNNMATTFHGKGSWGKDVAREDQIWDDILRKYNTSLVPKVDGVVQKLFPLH